MEKKEMKVWQKVLIVLAVVLETLTAVFVASHI